MLNVNKMTPEVLKAIISPPKHHYQEGGPDECWAWSGYVDKKGYARTNFQMKSGKTGYVAAHRITYALAHPELDVHRVRVQNLCGTKTCGNPAHWHALWNKGVVSPETKQRQRSNARRGEHHSQSILTWEQVRAMRAKRAEEGRSYTAGKAAKEYGVSAATTYKIFRNESWIEENVHPFPKALA